CPGPTRHRGTEEFAEGNLRSVDPQPPRSPPPTSPTAPASPPRGHAAPCRRSAARQQTRGTGQHAHQPSQRRAATGLADHDTPETALKQTTSVFHPNPREKG